MSASACTSSRPRARGSPRFTVPLHGRRRLRGNAGPARRRVSAFVYAGPYNAEPDAGPGQPVRALALAVRGTARAKVAELVDALDLGSSGATLESSSLSFRTTVGLLPSLARAVRGEE